MASPTLPPTLPTLDHDATTIHGDAIRPTSPKRELELEQDTKLSDDLKGDPYRAEEEGVPSRSAGAAEAKDQDKAKRPPLDYSSPKAFMVTFADRLKSIFTLRFVLCLIAGQIVSWAITGTNSITTVLVYTYNFNLPTTQTFFLYFSLLVVYTPYTMYRYGLKGWLKLLYKDGWKYAILAAFDMEGNFLVVKAYQYTNLLSCMLLDAWAIPCCMFFSWILIKTKYRWTQILGVFICVLGLGLLVGSDQITAKDYVAANMGLGDGYMVVGATFYGFTNALEEFLVRKRPLYEVVGQLGFWGVIWNGIQASALEHEGWVSTTWSGPVIGYLFLYTFCLFVLYTLSPLLYRSASAVFYNLSLLTSDFFGLLIGLGVFGYEPYWLYFVAFVIVIIGLIVYFWSSPPEDQAPLTVERPTFVHQVDDPDTEPTAGLGGV